MPKWRVRLKSAATPTLAEGLHSCPHPYLCTAEIPASGANVTFCAYTPHTLAISRQAKTTFFFIVFRSNLCVTRSVYGWMMSLIPLSSRVKYINNIITVIIFCAFLKPHLHCFANRSFLVTGSIGCISLASGCGVMTLTGTCVPLPVLFPQIKKREIL